MKDRPKITFKQLSEWGRLKIRVTYGDTKRAIENSRTITEAAKKLGISRTTMSRIKKKFFSKKTPCQEEQAVGLMAFKALGEAADEVLAEGMQKACDLRTLSAPELKLVQENFQKHLDNIHSNPIPLPGHDTKKSLILTAAERELTSPKCCICGKSLKDGGIFAPPVWHCCGSVYCFTMMLVKKGDIPESEKESMLKTAREEGFHPINSRPIPDHLL